MSLEALPTELVAQILENVQTSGSRYNCLLVCRRFYDLMQPLIYRELNIPFLRLNRLVTLVRAVRKHTHLSEHTRSLTIGEDPYDPKRTVERLIGRDDISKLFPGLRKVQLYAMTFERGMMYRFLAYCARMPALEELVLQYPDLVPLVQPISGLKKLTWSVTMDEDSPVFRSEEGREETAWIQNRFVASLGMYCPALESLELGCLGREAQWGIADRQDAEFDATARMEVESVRLEKLREFAWRAGEGMAAASTWSIAVAVLLAEHAAQLETLRWELAGSTASATQLLSWLPYTKAVRRLELQFWPGCFIEVADGDGEYVVLPLGSLLAQKIEAWWCPVLQEVCLRYSVISGSCGEQVRVLQALHCAKQLRRLEVTFGVPMSKAGPTATARGSNPGDTELLCWYFDEVKMTEFLESLPPSLESLVVNFDGKHDVLDGFERYEFEQQHDNPLPEWEEEYKARVKEMVNQTKSIPRKVLFDRLPNLREAFIGGYDLVD
ncbi:hypothetical protein TWF696_006708 [Orbilia brochopaga]|uniref:F-box domain-containing protein n=1 Tax=Orbilia brochopaga TaxID=3140254 RepID=A0AAV9UPJ0_9PEZI